MQAQASPADLLLPTATPKRSWFDLFFARLKKIRPKNFTNILTNAPTWGNPYDGKCAEYWGSYPVIVFFSYNPYTLSSQESDYELMDEVELLSCGWQPNESLKLTIKRPDGRKSTINLRANSQGNPVFKRYSYRARLDEPAGNYTFSISGPSGSAENSTYIDKPHRPNIYWFGDNQVLLSGFSPRETVRLGAYSGTGPTKSFLGWQDAQVDSRGELWMRTDFSGDASLLLDQGSRNPYLIVELVPGAPDKGIEWKEVCILLQPTRLSPGQTAWVVSDRLSIYAEPDSASQQVRNVWRNSRMTILEGPQCHGNRYWYRIRNNNGWEGWVQEADEFTYFIRP